MEENLDLSKNNTENSNNNNKTNTEKLKVSNSGKIDNQENINIDQPDVIIKKSAKGWRIDLNNSTLPSVNLDEKYIEEINKGNWDFFINKDYTEDLQYTSSNVVNVINDVKIQLRDTSNENKQKALKYVQNLCKICNLYYQ